MKVIIAFLWFYYITNYNIFKSIRKKNAFFIGRQDDKHCLFQNGT